MYVSQLREEVVAIWELVHHQFHHVEEEGGSVHCVLDIRNTTQVLQVEGLQLVVGGRVEWSIRGEGEWLPQFH